jgi:hypothetical protein
MIWIFERQQEVLRVETRFDIETAEFVLRLTAPSGAVQVERFRNVATFQQRLEVLEAELEAERWVQQGPVFLHDGWKGP